MAKTLFEDASRANAFRFRPEDLVIVGLDTNDGPEHPQYDERIELPIDDALVKSIGALGVVEPVVVSKDSDGNAIVVAGRQRVRAARFINVGRRSSGQPEVLVPCVPLPKGTSQAEATASSLTENAVRQDDNALVVAEKAARFIKANGDDSNTLKLLAASLGLTAQRLDDLLRLRESVPAIRKAIQDGNLGVSAAITLAKLPVAEQEKALSELQSQSSDGVVTTAAAQEKVAKVRGNNPRPSPQTVRRVVEYVKNKTEFESNPVALALLWIAGEVAEGEVPGLTELLRDAPKVSGAAKRGPKGKKEADAQWPSPAPSEVLAETAASLS